MKKRLGVMTEKLEETVSEQELKKRNDSSQRTLLDILENILKFEAPSYFL